MPPRTTFLPVVFVLAGVAGLSLMDAFMKSAALAAGAFTATWLRSVFGLALVAPVWLFRSRPLITPGAMRLHLLRGTVSTAMALTFFYALTKLPIAEAIAISFIAPLIALYLARLILGETIRREAIAASILGFAGTLIVVGGRLGSGPIDADTLLGLAAILVSAVLYAYNFIIIRQQSQAARPVEIAVFHSAVPTLLIGLATPLFFKVPEVAVALDILAAAALTVGAAMTLAWAYARAEAQTLVPLEYSGFVWASLFGWMFFRETVSVTTLAGTALIVAGSWLAARSAARRT